MDGARQPGSKPPNGTDEIRPWGDAAVLHFSCPDDTAIPVGDYPLETSECEFCSSPGGIIRRVDIPFERVPTICYSTAGTPFTKFAPVGMPKLGKYKLILDIVFFLYRSVEDARIGKDSGGTGFLVAVPTPWPGHDHIYGVTNWHVAVDQGASVVRINTKDGSTDIFEFGPEDWQFIPNYHDIAVVPLSIKGHHKVKYLENRFLASEDYVREQEIGPGDDVFMVGRFIDFDGAQTNRPSLRFGHISMVDAPITQPNGYVGEGFVVDMHSRTGFSGSPVFVYRTMGSHFFEGEKGSLIVGAGHMMSLLGIHWGQFPELWELKGKSREELGAEGSMITDGAYVEGLSGMTCVCPAHAIRKVLDMPKEQERRRAIEQAAERVLGSPDSVPRAEIAPKPSTTEDNPSHAEDFNRLLSSVTKGKQPDDET